MNEVMKERRILVTVDNPLMRTGERQRAAVLMEPAGVNAAGVKWFTSDREIASVDDEGMICAHTEGRIALVAELDDGSGEYGAAWIRVTDAPETAEEYLLTFESENGSGDSFQMTAVKGLPMIMPYCTFTAPHGKMFLSWDMGGVTLREGDSIDFYCDAKIKAVWGRLP